MQVGDRVKLNPASYGSQKRNGVIVSEYKSGLKKKAWSILWDGQKEKIPYWEEDLLLVDDPADYEDDFK